MGTILKYIPNDHLSLFIHILNYFNHNKENHSKAIIDIQKFAKEIYYSDKYFDDQYEYR
jgi:hypothetical protein